ncbi:MAG: fused MFS/spermidine synthase [Deltaproteobacteria bacterium]|nr:fused MFS/spermidine synthase [Deltaproteobacteria bacterium]
MSSNNWIIDYSKKNRSFMYEVNRVIVQTESPHQEIIIADTQFFGRAVFLDGMARLSGLDRQVYYEALVHPAMLAHAGPRRVFVAGGGEGLILNEILKHSSVDRVVLAERDETLVRLAKEHLQDWLQGVFDDSRVEAIYRNPRDYLANTEDFFDVIFIDVKSDFEEFPSPFATSEFYALAKSRLAAGGILATIAEHTEPGFHLPLVSIIKTLSRLFEGVVPYHTPVTLFADINAFALAGPAGLKDRCTAAEIGRAITQRNLKLKHYDPESHQGMFAMPKHIRTALADPHAGGILHEQ